ncbi:MAG: phage major capsid protein [Acidovorax sp.]|uniref:phage major capsid protein n=1 Tax=Acidovorax sp. TaxID=1872122 RepID=UPI0026200402|nr:phage major capsid protein [Acidovorax sp.]MDH4425076.1 phage major capsid protein [Acidovorax sp.]
MTIQNLRERLGALKKDARNLLENKGSATWTKEEQAQFDNLADEAERVERQIDAHQRLLDNEAEDSFSKLPTKEKGAKVDPAMAAYENYLRKMSNRLTAQEIEAIRNTMSTTTGSEGGFTVQPVVASTLIEALKDFGAMRRLAERLVTTTGADLSFPSTDGTSEEGEIIAQNLPSSDADIAFGTVPLNTYKFSSKVVAIPIELLQDSNIDVVALVNRRLRERVGRIQNRLFSMGTGTAQPFGVATAATAGKVGTTGQTLTVTYDDLVDLVDSIDPAYQTEAQRFHFSQTVRRVVRKIKDTAGRPIWTPSYDEGMSAKTPDLLLGYPVEINNHMPVPAANAKSITFGDHSKYIVRDAMELTMFRFEDSAYLKKGQVGFMAWARAGGNLTDTNAVKAYQHSAT